MSLLLERLAEHGSVPLEGYGHQVGGHFLLMKFEDAAICKPLIQREHFFYETLPDDLKLFLPAYYGRPYKLNCCRSPHYVQNPL